jgi:23S rRNA (guanine745-N1)-methyltransferase
VDLERLAGWLRCPSCGAGLHAVPPLVLRCDQGHAVDANKRGYVSMLPPRTRVTGDTAPMLAARARFLDAGHYSPIVDALVTALALAGATTRKSESPLRILDAGCGTGHYLRALLDRLPAAHGLAADLSVAAVRTAVQGRDDVDGLVADTWAGLPVRDGAADLLLDVFAPRNMADFHRALAPGGHLAIVAAGPDHLRQLREAGRAVGVQPDKRERILESASGLFAPVSETSVHADLQLSAADVDLLLGMGPSAHHLDAGAHGAGTPPFDRPQATSPVTLDVTIHVLRRDDVVEHGTHAGA